MYINNDLECDKLIKMDLLIPIVRKELDLFKLVKD